MRTPKEAKRILLIGGVLILLLVGCDTGAKKDVNITARQASVQTVFHLPVLKAHFAEPWEPDKPEYVELTQMKKLVQEQLDEALKKQKELENQKTHNSYLTDLDKYGAEPVSATVVPLAPLAPENAKFPERVIVAVQIEKEKISPWDAKYDEDVLSISETADVSPSKAKKIIRDLRGNGYSISKDTIAEAEETTLLWFDRGWEYTPSKLYWSVTVEGEKANIIVDYDALNSLLITKPIPEAEYGEYRRVHVEAGYFDLIDKPDSTEVKELKKIIDDLKDNIKDLETQIEDLTEEEEEKRDIRDVTWMDVRLGRVIVEQYWVVSAASGVFLGNMKARKEFNGYGNNRLHTLSGENMGVVLTNAHVAEMAMRTSMYVTEDNEKLWIVFPGFPFVRYTQDSDLYGSPAKVLMYDMFPVSSLGCDTAIMVTTAVPGYERYKAHLGNSDNVTEGDEVIMVGNPAHLQKYSFRGVITNRNYSILDSFVGKRILQTGISKEEYDWLQSSSMWFDAEGTGGTSGSGVWATEGSQKGKVIALHNMGMIQPTSVSATAEQAGKKLDPKTIWNITGSIPLKDAIKDKQDVIFANYSYKDAQYEYSYDEFIKEERGFKKAIQKRGYVDMPGMNAGVAINAVKRYLQERGLDPDHFGWKSLDGEYWEK